MQGGCFTITNGYLWLFAFNSYFKPPTKWHSWYDSIQQRPVAVNGEVVIRPMMYVALSYDHRVIDGKEAVHF